jgi:hypothetical protein
MDGGRVVTAATTLAEDLRREGKENMARLAERVGELLRRVEAAEGYALEIVTVLLETKAREQREARERRDDPVVVRDPLDGTPLVRLSDVRRDAVSTSGPAMRTSADVITDPQAAFVKLAEQVGSYRVAAREHPDAWTAYREAADLNGNARAQLAGPDFGEGTP